MWSIPTRPVVQLSSCPETGARVVQAGPVAEAGLELILQPQFPNSVFTIVRHHALGDCTPTPHEVWHAVEPRPGYLLDPRGLT